MALDLASIADSANATQSLDLASIADSSMTKQATDEINKTVLREAISGAKDDINTMVNKEKPSETHNKIDEMLTGVGGVARKLNQLLNNIPEEYKLEYKNKAMNKTPTEKLDIAQKIYDRLNPPLAKAASDTGIGGGLKAFGYTAGEGLANIFGKPFGLAPEDIMANKKMQQEIEAQTGKPFDWKNPTPEDMQAREDIVKKKLSTLLNDHEDLSENPDLRKLQQLHPYMTFGGKLLGDIPYYITAKYIPGMEAYDSVLPGVAMTKDGIKVLPTIAKMDTSGMKLADRFVTSAKYIPQQALKDSSIFASATALQGGTPQEITQAAKFGVFFSIGQLALGELIGAGLDKFREAKIIHGEKVELEKLKLENISPRAVWDRLDMPKEDFINKYDQESFDLATKVTEYLYKNKIEPSELIKKGGAEGEKGWSWLIGDKAIGELKPEVQAKLKEIGGEPSVKPIDVNSPELETADVYKEISPLLPEYSKPTIKDIEAEPFLLDPHIELPTLPPEFGQKDMAKIEYNVATSEDIAKEPWYSMHIYTPPEFHNYAPPPLMSSFATAIRPELNIEGVFRFPRPTILGHFKPPVGIKKVEGETGIIGGNELERYIEKLQELGIVDKIPRIRILKRLAGQDYGNFITALQKLKHIQPSTLYLIKRLEELGIVSEKGWVTRKYRGPGYLKEYVQRLQKFDESGHIRVNEDGDPISITPALTEAQINYAEKIIEATRFTEEEFSNVLSHEIGHFLDWVSLPKAGMNKGNVLGRVLSELKFLKKSFFDETSGTTLNNEVLKNELLKLTKWWSGPFPENDPYRTSPAELYAEAISVYLNDRSELFERAPNFAKALEQYIDKKGEKVQKIIAEWNNMRNLKGDDLYDFLDKVEDSVDIEQKSALSKIFVGQMDELKAQHSWKKVLTTDMVTKFINDLDPFNKILVEKGLKRYWEYYSTQIAPEIDPLKELINYRKHGAMIEQLIKDYTLFFENKDFFKKSPKLFASTFSKYLKYQRLLIDYARDAKPGSETETTLKGRINYLENKITKEMGIEAWADILDSADFHYKFFDDLLKYSVEQRYISFEDYARIKTKNKAYTPFQEFDKIIEAHQQNLSPSGRGSVLKYRNKEGSLGNVLDALGASVRYIPNIIEAVEDNKVRLTVYFFLTKYAPEKISLSAQKHWTLQTARLDGQTIKFWVPPEINESIQSTFNDIEALGPVFQMIVPVARPIAQAFKNTIVKFNPWFTFSNAFKDPMESYKYLKQYIPELNSLKYTNELAVNLFELIKDEFFSMKSETLKDMKRNKAIIQDNMLFSVDEKRSSLSEIESFNKQYLNNQSELLKIIEADGLSRARLEQSTSPENIKEVLKIMQDVLMKLGKSTVFKPFEWIARINEVEEKSTKMTVWTLLKKHRPEIDTETRAFLSSALGGTPNIVAGGTTRSFINSTFNFQNVATQSILRLLNYESKELNKQGFKGQESKIKMAAAILWNTFKWSPVAVASTIIPWYLKTIYEKKTGKDSVYHNSSSLIIKNYFVIPLPWLKDKYGNPRELTFFKPPTAQLMSAMLWNVLDLMYEHDAESTIQFMNGFLETVNLSSNSLNAAYATILGFMFNRKDNGQSISDARQFSKAWKLQYRDYIFQKLTSPVDPTKRGIPLIGQLFRVSKGGYENKVLAQQKQNKEYTDDLTLFDYWMNKALSDKKILEKLAKGEEVKDLENISNKYLNAEGSVDPYFKVRYEKLKGNASAAIEYADLVKNNEDVKNYKRQLTEINKLGGTERDLAVSKWHKNVSKLDDKLQNALYLWEGLFSPSNMSTSTPGRRR